MIQWGWIFYLKSNTPFNGVAAIKSIFNKGSQSGLRALLLALLSIMLMIMDNRVATVQQIRSVLSVTLLPLQYLVSAPVQLFDNVNQTLTSHSALVKENLALKAEQLLLRAQVQRLLSIESENNQLKALMSTSAQVQGKVLVAQLLAVNTDPFLNQVILDKGSRDNVFVGQPVLDANGVMGQVIQVGPLSSRVLLINDPHNGVPVQVTRNGVRAIATGDNYTRKLRLVNVPHTTDIKPGDMLTTSGLGEHFPEGYPVGQVVSVEKDQGYQFATILVEPSAHLDRSREVLLVWPNQTAPNPVNKQVKS